MPAKNATTTGPWIAWPLTEPTSTESVSVSTPPFKIQSIYDRCKRNSLLLPFMDESNWSDNTRAVLYFIGLLYCFLGIAVLSDALMRAVERITNSTRKVKLKEHKSTDLDEEEDEGSESGHYDEIRIWNPSVANLTLMTLASNAPQILLPSIQIIGNSFHAIDLGPATIVGSAAFNLLILIPACILAVPASASKGIHSIRVYWTTICWSIFSCIWMIIILSGSSPKFADIWESTLTLILYPLAVFTIYLAHVNICEKWRRKRADARTKSTIVHLASDVQVVQADVDFEIPPEVDSTIRLNSVKHQRCPIQWPQNPLDYVDTSEWRELSRICAREHPELPPYELAKLVAYRLDNERWHDRLWYRIRAVKRLSASTKREAFFDPDKRRHIPVWSLMSGIGMRTATSVSSISTLRQATMTRSVKRAMTIEFSARVYVLDPANENRVRLTVVRRGRTHKKAMFRYETLNGNAQRELHYLYKCETVVFQPGETHKVIHIDILNGSREWKRRDMFYVKLELDTIMLDEKIRIGQSNPAEIVYPAWERDNIEVEFAKSNVVVRENDGIVRLPIVRKGAIKDTECAVEWSTEDITAQQGKDYEGARGEMQFFDGEREKYLDITIIDYVQVEKTETFAVNIINVTNGTAATNNRAVVTILNDDRTNRFLTHVDQMVPTVLQTLEDTGRTWRDQLMEASCVNDGDVDNATPLDCIAHILAFPWKVLRAAIPPVSFLGGWLTFVIGLILMGILTTIVGDLAIVFSCTVGLSETLVGITIMAFGLNLPDLLAARLAARMDKTADTAIGYIPGVNVVNILLGLGLPWFMASIVKEAQNLGQFNVVKNPRICELCFAFVIFTVCSIFCYGTLFARRRFRSFGKAELGGPTATKILCAAFLFFLWFLMALLCSLKAYNIIHM